MTKPIPARPTIALYGAIDRFNYGDLLFPIVLTELLEGEAAGRFKIECVGLRRSDLRSVGALETQSLRWLVAPKRLHSVSAIIVVGGEVLAADWLALASYLLPEKTGDAIFAFGQRILGKKRLNRVARACLGAPWKIPFVIDPEALPQSVPVLYNQVGGIGLPDRSDAWQSTVATLLQNAAYCSVREGATHNFLAAANVTSGLGPDCAVLISDLFPLAELEPRLQDETRRVIDESQGAGYLCFQCNRYIGPGKLGKIALQLDALAAQTGMRIVLLPLGRVPGHSDGVALKRLQSLLKSDAVMVAEANLFDIMALIAGARCFIGTSLHGIITAMSYGVPYIGLDKAQKAGTFLETWGYAPFKELAPTLQLAEIVSERCEGRHAANLAKEAQALKEMARASFQNLYRALPD